jgi:hypothetical protein
MDITTIAKKAVQFVLPFVAKNKTVKKITTDVTEAANTSLLELWEWMKPLFIEEFEKDGTLEEDAASEAIVAREVKKKMEKADASELDKLKALLTQLQSDEAQGKLPKTNTIRVTGSKNITLQDVRGKDININSDPEKG